MRQAGPALQALTNAALLAVLAVASGPLNAESSAPPVATVGGLETVQIEAESSPTERLLDGTVEAVNQATVSAQTAGRVTACRRVR
jgi:hypothetical protein